MTNLISAPIAQAQVEADKTAAAAVAALAVLEDAWSYYTPEAPVATREVEAQDGVIAYYEAA
ncbi:hypothetical protein [Tritonibacter mobilis]|uniref:hypothetical protein n=1 Tax=Tritonibacter mobilis TaxID=379347 RepID=UPI0008069A32|nr:hypothetical protein [Tritonibacter mobilis]GLP87502.1 hypothetical protein GCM10007921_30620 [Tritonibacter mobilis]SDX54778.1 hypothetical protein SAMN05444385_10925 [Tritonibacter mobilis]